MTHTVRFVLTPEMTAGFGLAGMRIDEVGSVDEGVARILELTESDEVGVIITERQFMDAMPEGTRGALEARPTPIIVSFARPAWERRPGDPAAYVLEILERAIGYRVRLQ